MVYGIFRALETANIDKPKTNSFIASNLFCLFLWIFFRVFYKFCEIEFVKINLPIVNRLPYFMILEDL